MTHDPASIYTRHSPTKILNKPSNFLNMPSCTCEQACKYHCGYCRSRGLDAYEGKLNTGYTAPSPCPSDDASVSHESAHIDALRLLTVAIVHLAEQFEKLEVVG